MMIHFDFFLNQLRLTRMRYIILTHNRIWRWCLPILHTQVVVQWSYIYHRKEQHVHWQMRTCFQIHLPAMTRHKPHMFMTQSKNLPKLNNYDAQHVRKIFVLWETGMLYIMFKQVFFSPVTCFLLSFSLDFLLENNLMEIEKHDLNLAFTIFKMLQMTLQNLWDFFQ